MKLLIVGIDGGDEQIFRSFPMPNLHRVLDAGVSTQISEDLWTRGWAEMLTNETVLGMGGTYTRPLADGTRTFTQRFGKSQMEANDRVTPLWNLLQTRKIKSGFMNVPGTFPASPVDAFMVSGAGAGVGAVRGIPDELCSSTDVHQDLVNAGYISDTRFMTSGIREMDPWFDRLELMLRRRAEAFVTLACRHQLQFGMLALMATTRVQYLMMSEIRDLIDRRPAADADLIPQSPVQQRIVHLYRQLDGVIGELFERLQPDHFIITSDHAAAPFKHTANVRPFLEEIGVLELATRRSVQRTASTATRLMPKSLLQFASKVLPVPRTMQQNVWQKIQDPVQWDRTKAFGHRYIPGIYIFDQRFGGEVREAESKELVDRIVCEFNDFAAAKEYKMQAAPFRMRHPDSPFQQILPDIWIDAPEEIFFEGQGKFVDTNPHYGPVTDLRSVTKDMHTGIKGRNALLICDPATSGLVRENDSRNLTLVYRLADRTFSQA